MLAVAAAGLLAVPASASAIGFTGLSTTPANTQAGANTNFSIHLEFTNAGDDVRNLRIGLPAGQIADPNATPLCTVAQLNGGSCPANTQVGSLSSVVNALGIPLPVTVNGALYNLVPQPGEPARFGIILSPLPPLPVGQIILQSAVELRQNDFGLDTIINDIPNTALGLLPIDIVSMDVNLFGTANGNPFSRNPTSCEQATTNFSATSYSGSTTVTPATGQASYTPTGCGSLPFDPKFTAEARVADPFEPGSKVALTTVIEQTATEAGLKDAVVFVPSDLQADLNRLLADACPPAQFTSHSCPPNTVVGSTIATSPLLSAPLTGPVILVSSPAGLPMIGLDLQGQLNLLIQGQLGLDGSNTFLDLPDIPISHFELVFDGGPNGLLAAQRDICKSPPIFHTDFLGHNGATRAGDTPGTVTGCGPPRSPTAKVKVKGGGSEHPRLTFKAKSASGWLGLKKLVLKLPRQLAFDRSQKGSVQARAQNGALGNKAVKLGRRRLTLKVPAPGAVDAKAVVKGQALDRLAALPGKLRFRAKLIDAEGGSTSVRIKVRPKR